jgi:hypothetical protein
MIHTAALAMTRTASRQACQRAGGAMIWRGPRLFLKPGRLGILR